MTNAIITGSSKGIGKAIAQILVENNCNVILCGRNEKQLENVKQDLQKINKNVIVEYYAFDQSDVTQINNFEIFVKKHFSTIDILVNNAGQFIPGQIINEADGLLEKLLQINLLSAYHITRKLLPLLLLNTKGHIFNISSIAGLQAYQNGGAYSISKFALTGFSKNLREELKSKNIKVTTIYPGAVYTDSWNGSGVAEDRIMNVTDIASTLWNAYTMSPSAVIEDIVLRPTLGDL